MEIHLLQNPWQWVGLQPLRKLNALLYLATEHHLGQAPLDQSNADLIHRVTPHPGGDDLLDQAAVSVSESVHAGTTTGRILDVLHFRRRVAFAYSPRPGYPLATPEFIVLVALQCVRPSGFTPLSFRACECSGMPMLKERGVVRTSACGATTRAKPFGRVVVLLPASNTADNGCKGESRRRAQHASFQSVIPSRGRVSVAADLMMLP